MTFDEQQGYIQLDGGAVSAAAMLAYVDAEAVDAKVNLQRQQEQDIRVQGAQYLLTDEARLVWAEVVGKHTTLRKRSVRTVGFFWDTVKEVEENVYDEEAIWEELWRLDKRWLSAESDFWQGTPSYSMNRWYGLYTRPPQSSACYFEQFFDLKGTVYLTLEQYSRLKGYINMEEAE